MSVEDFLKNPSTVEKILSSLDRKTTLPNEGFVAGGSVANMLLSLYHKCGTNKFPINDIDVFTPIDPNTLDATKLNGEGENLLIGDVHLGLTLNTDDEGYGHVYVERDGTYYRVIRAERDGIINKISCFVNHGYSGGKSERYTPEPPVENPDQVMFPVTRNIPKIPNIDPDNDVILRGFDLNCCQAGIDLKSGVLHYTDSFVKFLKSKQVLVDIPYTPFHTAIRLVKKMEMYGDFCYCDLDYEMNYLYQATQSDEACLFFGKENYDKFIIHHEWLHEYIEVSPVDIKNMPHDYRKKYFPNSFKPNIFVENDVTYTPSEYNELSGAFTNRHDDYIDTEMVEGRELWTYKFTKEFKDIPDEFERMWELKKIWDFKYRNLKKSHKKKIDMIMGYNKTPKKGNILNLDYVLSETGMSYPVQCLITNDFYYKCDFTTKHLDEIVSFINQHRRLGKLLSKTNNVQEQYNNVKMIKSLAKQEGEWIIGTLETLGLKKIWNDTIITKEWVDGLIEEEKQRMSEPLCEPYDLSGFKYKDYVTELTTPLALQAEGLTYIPY
jgi:hypothetical protein